MDFQPLTQKMLQPSELWPEISPYFENSVMVAHSVEFDFDVLCKMFNYYDMSMPPFLALRCTKEIFDGRSLEDACEALEIDLGYHHDAESDAIACAKLFIEYLKELILIF